MTFRTLDRSSDIYTVEKVGRTREVTAAGYLLCRDVPIARTGEMLYAAGELKDDDGKALEAGPDGIIHVTRDEAEVFRPETIASANGQPITDDHPDDDVTPATWNELAVGIVLNPRRGERTEDQLLIADFLITNKDAIKAVQDGKREVSCGYDASYDQISPGRAVQRNIIYNHVALVEHGRCGPRCSIGDHDMTTRVTVRPNWKDKIINAFKTKDEAALNEALQGVPADAAVDPDDGGNHVHIHLSGGEDKPVPTSPDAAPPAEAAPAWFDAYTKTADERFGKIEDALTALAPKPDPTPKPDGETTDEDLNVEPDGSPVQDEDTDPEGEKNPLKTGDKKTRDAAMKSDFQDAVSRAELIIPGVKVPTYDSADPNKATCLFRRRVLARARSHDSAGKLVASVLGKNADLKTMTCDAVTIAFNAVSELARTANNSVSRIGTYDRTTATGQPRNLLADMNKKAKEVWADKV
jgi:hypothetical protein